MGGGVSYDYTEGYNDHVYIEPVERTDKANNVVFLNAHRADVVAPFETSILCVGFQGITGCKVKAFRFNDPEVWLSVEPTSKCEYWSFECGINGARPFLNTDCPYTSHELPLEERIMSFFCSRCIRKVRQVEKQCGESLLRDIRHSVMTRRFEEHSSTSNPSRPSQRAKPNSPNPQQQYGYPQQQYYYHQPSHRNHYQQQSEHHSVPASRHASSHHAAHIHNPDVTQQAPPVSYTTSSVTQPSYSPSTYASSSITYTPSAYGSLSHGSGGAYGSLSHGSGGAYGTYSKPQQPQYVSYSRFTCNICPCVADSCTMGDWLVSTGEVGAERCRQCGHYGYAHNLDSHGYDASGNMVY